MKIALAQYRPSENIGANLNLALSACGAAVKAGAELLCFNQFFLGMVPNEFDADLLETLSQAAKTNNLAIVTGSLVINAQSCKASSAFFNPDGKLDAYEPEKTADCGRKSSPNLFITKLGPLLVLDELEAYDSGIDSVVQQVKPKIILMQAGAISLLELEAIKELTIDRSYNQAHLVMTVSMAGEFAGQSYLGSTMAVMQGQILGEALTDSSDLLVVEVDPDHFVDYQVLREPVTIPELLQQKLVHEASRRELRDQG